MEYVYEVDRHSPYLMTLSAKPIEDVGDEFMTEEEFVESGLTGSHGLEYMARNNISRQILDKPKIRAYLNGVLADIKPGKKSGKIDDQDLIDALKESDTSASQIISGTRRVGNRLYRNAPKPKPLPDDKVRYKDWTKLINVVQTYLQKEYGLDIKIGVVCTDRHKSVEFVKKLVTVKELEEWAVEFKKENHWFTLWSDDVWDRFELIWKDPTLVPLSGKKK